MSDLGLLLLVKSTIVLGAGEVVRLLLRRGSASARHLVWVSTLAVLLLLPVGLLIPDNAAVPKAFVVSTAIGQAGAVMPAHASWPSLESIWAAGVVLLLLRTASSIVRAICVVRRACTISGSEEFDVRLASENTGPLAWSFGRGAVVLPRSAVRWRRATLEAAMKHEAAHLQRGDCQALLIAELACALYWFHPLVWYAARRLRIEQEHAADDAVLQAGTDPGEYASQLVELARFGRTEYLLAGAAAPSTLGYRVATILDGTRRRTVQNRRMVLSSVAAVLLTAIPLAALQTDKKIYKITDEGITHPQLIVKQEPKYTEEARDAKLQGTVTVTAVIGSDGKLSDIVVVEGLGLGLTENAIEALSSWVFRPAEKDGQPVRVNCTIQVNFRLK